MVTDYINPDNGSVKRVEKDTSNGITYIGYTDGGEDVSQPIWRIKRVQETVVGTVTTTTITYAKNSDGVQLFDAIRNDRATYTFI